MECIRLLAFYICSGILFLHQLQLAYSVNITHFHEVCGHFSYFGRAYPDTLYLQIDSEKIHKYGVCDFTVKMGLTTESIYRRTNNLMVEWVSVDSGQVLTRKQTYSTCRPLLRIQLDEVCFIDENIQNGTTEEFQSPSGKFRIELINYDSGYLKAILKLTEKKSPKTPTISTSTTTEMPNEELGIGPITGIVVAVTVSCIFCVWCCRKCCDDKEGEAETDIALAPIADQNETVHVYPPLCNQPARQLDYPKDPTHPNLPQPNVDDYPSNYSPGQNPQYNQNRYPQNQKSYFPNPDAAPTPPHLPTQSQYPPIQPPYPPYPLTQPPYPPTQPPYPSTAQYAPHPPYTPFTDSQNVPPSIQPPPPTDYSAPPPSYDSVMSQQSHEMPSAPAYEQCLNVD